MSLSERMNFADLSIRPLTSENWPDLETLFTEQDAPCDCWCMWFRLTGKQFEAQKGDQNRQAMQAIVASGRVPGLIASVKGQPVGWISVAPRAEFPRINRSQITKPVDDQLAWSIVCLFLAKPFRKQHLSVELIKAAVIFAGENGAQVVEGYPVEPQQNCPDAQVYHGLASSFIEAGFHEVARRSETRPLMRYEILNRS